MRARVILTMAFWCATLLCVFAWPALAQQNWNDEASIVAKAVQGWDERGRPVYTPYPDATEKLDTPLDTNRYDVIIVRRPAGATAMSYHRAGAFKDPVDDGALFFHEASPGGPPNFPTLPAGAVLVRVERRNAMGAIYWVEVLPTFVGGGGGGGGGPSGPTWWGVEVDTGRTAGALVLKDVTSGCGVQDDSETNPNPRLSCGLNAQGLGDIEFWLEAQDGEYTWEIVNLLSNQLTSGSWPNSVAPNHPEMRYKSWLSLMPSTYAIRVFTGSGENRHLIRQIDFDIESLDLDIDSDNDNGTGDPARTPAEDRIEGQSPGKFAFVNHNDDDNDGIPDYADLHVGGLAATVEQNFVPIVLNFRPQIDWQTERGDVHIRFAYQGAAQLPSMTGADLGSGFRNYTDNKTGRLRMWNVSSPGAVRTADNYIIPDHDYTATDLDFTTLKTFYVEGINAQSNSDIVVTVTYHGQTFTDTVRVTVVEPTIRMNNSNNDSQQLNPGTPDVTFTIDEHDEKTKFQGLGFPFWWGGSDRALPLSEFVNLAPLRIEIPQALKDQKFQFFVKVNRVSMSTPPDNPQLARIWLYPATSTPTDPLSFLKTVAAANTQAGQASSAIEVKGDATAAEIPFSAQQTSRDFLLKAIGAGRVEVELALKAREPGKTTGDGIPVDAVKITLQEPGYYWTLYSSRYEPPSGAFAYPTEDGRTATIRIFPVAKKVDDGHGTPPANRTVTLVHVHGYSAALEDVETGTSAIFKRLFWTGYRGNVVAFMWQGDAWNPLFDPNVYRAFQSAPRLRELLAGPVRQRYAGGDSANVYLSAHSLGNLVMYETLRLQELQAGKPRLVNNVMSIQTAVWREAFEPEQALSYPWPQAQAPWDWYWAALQGDQTDYSVDQLKRMSWRFWFRQVDDQAEHRIADVVNGRIFHNYAAEDYALYFWMRFNDANRGGDLGHYSRNEDRYRTLSDGWFDNHSMERVPALMSRRRFLSWSRYDLNLPVGCVINQIADVQINAPAETPDPNNPTDLKKSDWPIDSHDAFRSVSYPKMYNWYTKFFATEYNQRPSALPMGKEK